jgi:UDP-N-acetylglucosamine acyltransferase
VDLPPYTIACKLNILCGLNTVGMRRAGISSAHRLELKQLYRDLFRGGVNMRSAVSAAREKYSSPPSVTMLDFISASKRGVCSDISRDPMEFEADEE